MTHASIGIAGLFDKRPVERNESVRTTFGGPVNLARLFLMRRASMPVVCITCRTLNGKTARTCIGCAGKLPAYYAGGGTLPPDAVANSVAHRLAAGWRTVQPRWRLVVGVTALLVLSAVAFQAWFVAHAAAARSRPMVTAVTQRVAPAGSTAAVPVDVPTLRIATIEPVRVEPLPVSPVIVTALPPLPPSGARSVAGEAAVERVSAAGAARARGRAQQSDPLADCRSQWLFARAACLHDRCAQAPLKRHPQCQEVVAQRRLDEARRDGIVAN